MIISVISLVTCCQGNEKTFLSHVYYQVVKRGIGTPTKTHIDSVSGTTISNNKIYSCHNDRIGTRTTFIKYLDRNYVCPCCNSCLLYTSDAADEEDSVDLGGC